MQARHCAAVSEDRVALREDGRAVYFKNLSDSRISEKIGRQGQGFFFTERA